MILGRKRRQRRIEQSSLSRSASTVQDYSPHTAPSPCCWVPIFVDWAEGRTETLDFAGHEVPVRVQMLLESAVGPARR